MSGSERIAVVGVGAVGTLIAWQLNSAGYQPMLIFRNLEKALGVRKEGLRLILPDGGLTEVKGFFTTYSAIPDGSLELVFIATKAYDLEDALLSLRPKLKGGSTVVVCQNGIDPPKIAAKYLRNQSIGFMVLNHGVMRVGSSLFKYVGGKESFIGYVKHAIRELVPLDFIVDVLKGLNLRTVDDIMRYAWLKLLVNAGINPVTAILREENKVIIENEYARELAEGAVREGYEVGGRYGVNFPSDPIKALLEVAKATKNNKSSMLQDVESGRRTEVDFINGAIVRHGNKLGVDTPINRFLYLTVKALESRSSQRSQSLKIFSSQRNYS